MNIKFHSSYRKNPMSIIVIFVSCLHKADFINFRFSFSEEGKDKNILEPNIKIEKILEKPFKEDIKCVDWYILKCYELSGQISLYTFIPIQDKSKGHFTATPMYTFFENNKIRFIKKLKEDKGIRERKDDKIHDIKNKPYPKKLLKTFENIKQIVKEIRILQVLILELTTAEM